MTDSFVTQCPHCHTSFRVSHNQLSVARGAVRCGSCLHVFNAARQLLEQNAARLNPSDTLGPAADVDAPVPPVISTPAVVEIAEPLPSETPAAAPRESVQARPARAAGAHAAPVRAESTPTEPALRTEPSLRHDPMLDHLEDPPHYVWEQTRTPWSRRLLWVGLCLLGLLGLGAQYLWYQFDELARQDRYRPWFVQVCPQIGCKVPSKVDIALIKSSNLVVRSHPEFSGALVVDAIIYNRASFAQPFPLLELRFADLNGALIASRRFKPSEYLGGDLAGQAEMVPQTPIHIALDILDPGARAVNYSLSFRSPE
jgi:predicted Zn finger-like uncharacterized protein